MKQSDASAFVEFQYISCYSFSLWGPGAPPARQSFQYISCYSLSLTDIGKSVWLMSFNTSHVTLYPKDRFGLVNVITFQYISCYSLSQVLPIINVKKDMFQYISCYSLSQDGWTKTWRISVSIHLMLLFIPPTLMQQAFVSRVSIHLMLLFIRTGLKGKFWIEKFQYISCYSLSWNSWKQKWKREGFNTSHVTLYLFALRLWYLSRYCFNTSHVTLYHNQSCRDIAADVFQYISCYSLSNLRRTLYSRSTCFNTSHVTLYRLSLSYSGGVTRFQYISCYSLSNIQNHRILRHKRFNTSHVTLYRTSYFTM